MAKSFFEKCKEVLSIDLRSAAFFRIFLGFVLLFDLILRMKDLKAHYTDFGILPRYALLEKFSNQLFISLHNISGIWEVQLVLFLVAIILAICMILGFRTRFATILSWVFLISLQNRNGIILQGGDVMLRVILFWAMFLPLGAVWSIDALKSENKMRRVLSIGSVGLLLQIMFVYVFSGLLKNHPIWYSEGSAIYYALSLDQFRTFIGTWLYHYPVLMQFLTFGVLFWELVGPFLLLVPIWFGQIRTLTVFGFVLMHIGMGLTMLLGHFPWVAFCAFSALLPGWFWDKLRIGYDNFNFGKLRKLKEYASRSKIELHWIISVIGIILIVLTFLWNVQTLGKFDLPNVLEKPMLLLRLDQQWNMFAPYPLLDDGWYVIPGQLVNGSEIDVYRDQGVNYDKPKYASDFYKDERWRKYLMNLWSRDNSEYRLYYGKYLCRNWNDNHSVNEQLLTFNITYVKETTLPNYQTQPIEKVVIWSHNCFG